MCERFHLKRSSICSRVRGVGAAGAALSTAVENVSISLRSYFASVGSRKCFRDVFAQEFPEFAWLKLAEIETAEADAFERGHVVADAGEHPPHLAVLSFAQFDEQM